MGVPKKGWSVLKMLFLKNGFEVDPQMFMPELTTKTPTSDQATRILKPILVADAETAASPRQVSLHEEAGCAVLVDSEAADRRAGRPPPARARCLLTA
jgi:hypothetical protein